LAVDDCLKRKFCMIEEEHPYVRDFFLTMALPVPDGDCAVDEFFAGLDPFVLEELGIDRNEMLQQFTAFMERMEEIHQGFDRKIYSVGIVGGHDKYGNAEVLSLEMKPGEIICIVGPTGSGKSRLLADIEWLAQGDTPTGRRILINGEAPPEEWRFSLEHKLVAQLSQNMNFVMDMSVEEFVRMHAESRMIPQPQVKAGMIIAQANRLAGEAFAPGTPITALSGGQSRSLMIADTAFLSASPIVLIDEIENAGIDRKIALDLLVKKEKIVLMATHDPVLALMGDKRLVIRNGGIHKILETSPEERTQLAELEKLDNLLLKYRNMLRNGERLSGI
jgi:ABC-type lipoprotein export system ATPase subunit